MKRSILGYLLGVCSIWVLAGNRADINSDQSVDALDLSELANVLAGNLDISGYELDRVVVVAETGGDFDDPADAADWVAGRNPSPLEPYVIIITPGSYTLQRSLIVPKSTLIKGYGDNVTELRRSANGVDGAVVKFLGPTAYQMRVEGLYINNVAVANSGPIIAVLVQDCRPEIVDCDIKAQCSSGSYDAIGIRVTRSTETTNITIKNTEVSGVVTSGASGVAIGVELYDSTLYGYDCVFSVFQYADAVDAYVITVERSAVTPGVSAYRSKFSASADAGHDYYFFRYGAFGFGNFYSCRINSGNTSNVSLGSGLEMIYCYDSGCNPFP